MSRNSLRVGLALLAVVGGLMTAAPSRVLAQGFNPYAAMAQQGLGNRIPNLAAYQQAIAGVGMNPYTPGLDASNPYTTSLGGYSGGMNPYSPYGYGGYPTGIYGPYGSTLFGAGEFMKGAATALTSQEQARLMRQQAEQARLQTIKQRFDLEMYIRANTPTFTEEQAKVTRQTLRRLQNGANPAEVSSGKALNFLLDDVAKAPGKKVAMDPVPLSEGVLSHINVRRPNAAGNLGALRNDGRLSWPLALQQLLTPKQRQDLEAQAKALMRDAAAGKVDPNVLRDFTGELEQATDLVARKVNDLSTPQYLEAKRFLSDLNDARLGIESGLAPAQASFQKFIGGGKTIQDVMNYMTENGLVFAPATLGDEAAYRALYSALVAYNIAFNSGPAEAKE